MDRSCLCKSQNGRKGNLRIKCYLSLVSLWRKAAAYLINPLVKARKPSVLIYRSPMNFSKIAYRGIDETVCYPNSLVTALVRLRFTNMGYTSFRRLWLKSHASPRPPVRNTKYFTKPLFTLAYCPGWNFPNLRRLIQLVSTLVIAKMAQYSCLISVHVHRLFPFCVL